MTGGWQAWLGMAAVLVGCAQTSATGGKTGAATAADSAVADAEVPDDVQYPGWPDDVPADLPPTGGDRGLCDPCSTTAQCATPGAACVALGEPAGAGGSFCQAACGAGGVCPPGSQCAMASTPNGTAASVCVPLSESCGCSPAAMAEKWTTSCFHVGYDVTGVAVGQCKGTWQCTSGGAVCDAPLPVAEVCDGVDNDCDGTTDEEVSCDDADPCTQGDACVAGNCASGKDVCGCHADADCPGVPCGDKAMCDKGAEPWHCVPVVGSAPVCDPALASVCAASACDPATGQCALIADADGKVCDADGNPCTVADHCQAGACVKGPIQACNDSNPCTFDACDAKTGCSHLAVAGSCEDGNACTVGDACKGGQCVAGGAKSCADGNPCSVDVCDIVSGLCGVPPVADGSACDDGNPCTAGDHCAAGQCQGGPAAPCDDGNPCTTDACAGKAGCVSVAGAGPCDDGNACTTGEACSGSACVGGSNVCDCATSADCAGKQAQNKCLGQQICNLAVSPHVCVVVAGTAVTCVSPGACLASACAAASGLCVTSAVADGKACDDGSACTMGDQCAGGACQGGGAPCDDDNPCTQDSCTAKQGCSHVAIAGPCQDGNACTTGDTCSAGGCVPGKKVDCGDGNDCTVDGCDVKTGSCSHGALADGLVCVSGAGACGAATCSAGKCLALAATPCDDGNPCTTDACLGGTGCKHTANSSPCDDKNACTLGDFCGIGGCQAGKPVACEDGNACTNDSCAAKSGCSHVANTAACSDSDGCTVGDGCKGGVCLAGAVSPCDDGNACTLDSCSAGVCNSDAKSMTGKGCPPSPTCNGAATCSAGACVDPPGTCPSKSGYEIWPVKVPATFGPAKTMYDPTGWHVIALTVAPADWAAFLAQVAAASQTGSYYSADITYDGVPYTQVGIRPFGYGSMFYNPKKPNIRLTFDHFIDKKKGPDKLHNLRLKASGQDRTFLRQVFSQTFVEVAGGNAPRWGWARVTVNGQPYGLYQVIEQVDKRMFKANFGNDEGNDYERKNACWGLNCPATGCADLASKYKGDGDVSEIVKLAQIAATGAPATWFAQAAKVVDIGALFAQYAVESISSDIDSLAAAGQNFTVYANTATGLLQFIPTGQDLVLGNNPAAYYDLATPWGAPNSWCKGRIDNFYTRVWQTPAAKAQLLAKMQALHCGAMSTAVLLPTIDAFHEMLKQDLYFDPKGKATPAETDAQYTAFKNYVTKRNLLLDGLLGPCP